MSAFIVSEKTMHRCVEAMLKPGAPREQGDELGRRLYALNQQAVIARYGDKAKDDAADLPEEYAWDRPLCTNKYQQLKSLRCLVYQCSEGNIPETSALYKEIHDKSIYLALSLIGERPEYHAAEWD